MAYLDALMEQMDPQAKAKLGGASPSPGVGTPGGFQAPVDPQTPIAPPSQPEAYQAKGPALGLEGFDAGKLGSGHSSPKYVFAKHAQGLGVNDRDELLRRLQADESGYFKDASFGGSKGDVLNIGGQLHDDFKGMNQFDVVRAMGEGGKGWQWADTGGGGAPQGGGSPLQALQSMPGLASVLDGSGADWQIAQGVSQYSEPSKYLAALMAQLGGQQ
jgi:hypothetical protein